MKRSKYIADWWRKEEEIEFTKNLIELKRSQVMSLFREIRELENKVISQKKEIFEIRLDAIGRTDPIDEYIKGE
jgi:hypothetical protein